MNKEIIDLFKERLEKGNEYYKKELDVFDGRDWSQEALEEALDLTVYIIALLLKIKKSDSRLITILSEKKGIQNDTEC